MNLYVETSLVRGEIGRLIRVYPELADDETLMTDVLEGETDAHRVIGRALSRRLEAIAMVAAIKEREADLAARRGRFEREADAMKMMIRSIMRIAGLQKLVLPEATVSVTAARASAEITDIDALPQGYFKLVRQADKTAIKAALEAGSEIPGAGLVYGEPGLTFRTT